MYIRDLTLFYRKGLQEVIFDLLKNNNLKEDISILSAPCGDGREVFSLALFLEEFGIKNYSIKGIDLRLNTNFLKNKKEFSLYNKDEFSNIKKFQEKLKEKFGININLEKYFSLSNNKILLDKEFKGKILFEGRDIKELKEDNTYDLVISLNFLYYFEPAREALPYFWPLYNSLKEEGVIYFDYPWLAEILEKRIKVEKVNYYLYKAQNLGHFKPF